MRLGFAILAIFSTFFLLGKVESRQRGILKESAIFAISEDITNANLAGTTQFDLPMLEALGKSKISTKIPWYDGVVTLRGFEWTSFMNLVGARGETVRAVALNGYLYSDRLLRTVRTLLAMNENGQYMSVRDKAPLFIGCSFDSNTDLQTQTYYGRSAWQLAKLIVE